MQLHKMENRHDRNKSYYSKFKLLKTSFIHNIHRIGHVVKDPISKRGGSPDYFDHFFYFLPRCGVTTLNLL